MVVCKWRKKAIREARADPLLHASAALNKFTPKLGKLNAISWRTWKLKRKAIISKIPRDTTLNIGCLIMFGHMDSSNQCSWAIWSRTSNSSRLGRASVNATLKGDGSKQPLGSCVFLDFNSAKGGAPASLRHQMPRKWPFNNYSIDKVLAKEKIQVLLWRYHGDLAKVKEKIN